MNTARIIYEQYKVLPKKVRKELKNLIINEDEEDISMSLLEQIEQGLEEVKAMEEGKIPSRTYADFKKELENCK